MGSEIEDADDDISHESSPEVEDSGEGDIYVYDVETKTRHLLVHGNASPVSRNYKNV